MGAINVPWTESKYSKNQINKAGKKICDDISDEDKKESYKIVANWRAAHAYPLYVISHKLRKICGKKSMVVHRLKRMDSIIGKLKRNPGMSLYGMQDLGGCRVIVPTIKDVYKIANEYENSRIRHILCKENDYLKEPKPDGYRCLHRVYEYKSDDVNSKYNRMKIEIQFRTYLQHLWATAVEVFSLHINANLKSGVGDPQYFRFFALVSTLFAMEEEFPLVPNTPNYFEDVVSEILSLDGMYEIINKLGTATVVAKSFNEVQQGADLFLMSLDLKFREIKVSGYKYSQIEQAITDYDELEKRRDTNNVLVYAKSLRELKAAYPNYFGDIGRFLEKLVGYINEYKEERQE